MYVAEVCFVQTLTSTLTQKRQLRNASHSEAEPHAPCPSSASHPLADVCSCSWDIPTVKTWGSTAASGFYQQHKLLPCLEYPFSNQQWMLENGKSKQTQGSMSNWKGLKQDGLEQRDCKASPSSALQKMVSSSPSSNRRIV